MTEPLYHIAEGRVPVLVNAPHPGTLIPPDIAARMTPEALKVPDTDWFAE
jgi:N-formylglutamate deformylase